MPAEPYAQQPGYPQPGYAQQPQYAPQPGAPAPDTRPKGLATTALILAVAGILVSLIGFAPVPWLGVGAALLGGIVLLVALVMSIVGLAGKRYGGKPLSVTALVLSVIGGFVAAFALFVAFLFTGLSAWNESGSTPLPIPIPSVAPDDGSGDGSGDGSADGSSEQPTAADEAAFLAQARPAVEQIMAEIDPSITPEMVQTVFSDETLITMGQTLLMTGDAGIDMLAAQAQGSVGDDVSTDQMRRLFQAIYDAAEAHLQ